MPPECFMASYEFLRDQMDDARRIADDKSKPANVRHTADARFWHLVKRVGALENQPGGATLMDWRERPDEAPDNSAYLIGHRENNR